MQFCGSALRSVLFSLALLASSLTPVQAQDTTGLDGVQAAYRDLIDLYYKPINPPELLRAGWTSLGADAKRRGAAAPPPLPDLPSDADAALATFSAAYTSYVANLPAGFSAAMVAA
ncbi:MAG: hypothetical protein LC797_08915, partial [Chloroflexi bacterium]|nr:hypothetical protein [Chloroflexota bacterium]